MLNYLIHSHDPSLPPARYIDIPPNGPVRASIIFVPGTHKDDVNTHIANLQQTLAGKVDVDISVEDEMLYGTTATVRTIGGSYNRDWFAKLVKSAVPYAFTGIAETHAYYNMRGRLRTARTATITVTNGIISRQLGLLASNVNIKNERLLDELISEWTTPGLVIGSNINDTLTVVELVFNNSLNISIGHVSMAVWSVCDGLRLDCRQPVIGH